MGLVLDTNVFIQAERGGGLDFTTEVTRVHAGLFAELGRQGLLIDAHDLIIAATTLSQGCALVTANLDKFQRVPGLEVLALPKL